MERNANAIFTRVLRLERELVLWRLLAVAAVAVLALGFAQEKTQKEIRLASEDGRQVIVLSPQGIEFSDRGKKLGEIRFETIGDGDSQEVLMKLSGQINARRMFVQEDKSRLSLSATSVAFSDGYTPRTMLTPDGVVAQDPGGRSKITLTTPSQGFGGLDFVEGGRLILGLGPFGKFRYDNPPRRDAGAIHIGDFGSEPKSRLITAGEGELHAAH